MEPGNAAIARAAIWTLGTTGLDEPDVELLRQVARRGSEPKPWPLVAEARAGRIAGAAIAVLGRARSAADATSPAAAAALDALWAEVDRGDIRARITAARGPHRHR